MTPNTDIIALRASIRDKIQLLLRMQESTSDLELFRRLGFQIMELEHRGRMLGRLEFATATEALAKKLAPLAASEAELDKAIADIRKFQTFLTSISKFLGLVDKVIDSLT